MSLDVRKVRVTHLCITCTARFILDKILEIRFLYFINIAIARARVRARERTILLQCVCYFLVLTIYTIREPVFLFITQYAPIYHLMPGCLRPLCERIRLVK